MGLGFLCLLFLTVQYKGVGVFGRIEYHTFPSPTPSRVTKHIPQVLSKVCYLKPNEGPCRANIKMYYYDVEEKNCTTFTWGGCQGNGNRFDSRRECLASCLSTANTSYKLSARPRYCDLSFDYGYCFGAITTYYYDRLWKVCKETIYSGCGGNQNNFKTKEKCDTICRFGKGTLNTTMGTTDSLKKFLIINPRNATTKRGLNQATTKARKTTTRKGDKTTKYKTKKPADDDDDNNDDDEGKASPKPGTYAYIKYDNGEIPIDK